MSLVRTWAGLMVLRVLVGVAEAGFLPCIILYLTFFYTREERTVRLSLVLSVARCAATFNAVFSSSSEVFLNGWMDIAGWRWMFFMEGKL